MEAEQKESLIRIVTAALLTAGAHLFMDAGPMKPGESLVTRLWESLPYFAAYAVISWNILIKAWKNIRRGQVFDENFLMAVASLGAFFPRILPKWGIHGSHCCYALLSSWGTI